MKHLIIRVENRVAVTGSKYQSVRTVDEDGTQCIYSYFGDKNLHEFVSQYGCLPFIEIGGSYIDSKMPVIHEPELASIQYAHNHSCTVEAWLDYLPKFVYRDDWYTVINKLLNKGMTHKAISEAVMSKAGGLYELYSAYPAAHSNHHAYTGGLLSHTYEALCVLDALTEPGILPTKVDVTICTLAIIYHDYGKTQEYTGDGEYQEQLYLTPHCYLGARQVAEDFSTVLSKSYLRRIEHAILAHHGRREYGAPCVPATIEAFVVNKCDEISGVGTEFAVAEHMRWSSPLERTVIRK